MVNREKKLRENLNNILKDLEKSYKPEKIILFGSLASGKIKNFSDIDLLIIKKTNKKYFDRIKEIVSLCDYNVGVDFLVYTPEEFKNELDRNIFFKEEIYKKGKVIYEKA